MNKIHTKMIRILANKYTQLERELEKQEEQNKRRFTAKNPK